jgi:hypothetical protein
MDIMPRLTRTVSSSKMETTGVLISMVMALKSSEERVLIR